MKRESIQPELGAQLTAITNNVDIIAAGTVERNLRARREAKPMMHSLEQKVS